MDVICVPNLSLRSVKTKEPMSKQTHQRATSNKQQHIPVKCPSKRKDRFKLLADRSSLLGKSKNQTGKPLQVVYVFVSMWGVETKYPLLTILSLHGSPKNNHPLVSMTWHWWFQEGTGPNQETVWPQTSLKPQNNCLFYIYITAFGQIKLLLCTVLISEFLLTFKWDSVVVSQFLVFIISYTNLMLTVVSYHKDVTVIFSIH